MPAIIGYKTNQNNWQALKSHSTVMLHYMLNVK